MLLLGGEKSTVSQKTRNITKNNRQFWWITSECITHPADLRVMICNAITAGTPWQLHQHTIGIQQPGPSKGCNGTMVMTCHSATP